MIRPGQHSDLANIIPLSREFWELTFYDEDHDDDYVVEHLQICLDHGVLVVLEIDGAIEGFAAGILFPLLANRSTLQVSELAYWINPAARGRHGLALIDALEKGAKAIGAKYINMIAMESSSPEVADAVYNRRGYTKLETTYCKKLEV